MMRACGKRLRVMNGNMRRHPLALAGVCALLLAVPATAMAQASRPRTFATAQDAVQSLIAAVKSGSLDELVAIFGPDGEALIASSDPANGRRNRQVFSVAVAEQWRLVDDAANRKTLVIGNEEWPFPVPIVKITSGWRFDTAAGKEEIIARRIGRNELEVIQTCLAFVTAQQRYAQQAHDGKPGARTEAKSAWRTRGAGGGRRQPGRCES
jgi:hypothetical protein